MAQSFEQYQRRRLISSYFSVVFSIFLVLFLLGALGLFVINSEKISNSKTNHERCIDQDCNSNDLSRGSTLIGSISNEIDEITLRRDCKYKQKNSQKQKSFHSFLISSAASIMAPTISSPLRRELFRSALHPPGFVLRKTSRIFPSDIDETRTTPTRTPFERIELANVAPSNLISVADITSITSTSRYQLPDSDPEA